MEIKVLSSVDKQTKFGKPMKALEVFCENETRKVNVFSNALDFANIKQGYTINGTMEKKGDYWDISFAGAEKRAGGAYKAVQKADIAEAQAVKAKNIAQAQDRSAWMWAKTNATTIVSSPNLRDGETSTAEEMVEKVIELATKIYNAEPLEPFN